MYHFRYYAIGHSYLKHGPFVGWQTGGFWGMAASKPENDYFHRFVEGMKQSFDCAVEALAENHAQYERLCTEDATEEKYTSSDEYAHMQRVIKRFKPNVITVFIGGGNTPARDDASLTLFFEVLCKMIADCKQPDAVVICIGIKPNIQRLFAPIAKQYGFIGVDASFIHEIKGRENPYYAFRDYPEYDALQAAGAVEFRTHPNDQGHAAIAEAILQASREALSRIPAGRFAESYSYAELLEAETPARLEIQTVPQMTVSYFGFNVRQSGECVTFGSAPGTGASLSARDFCVPYGCKRFYIELAIDGATEKDELLIELTGTDGTHKAALPVASGMHVYETAPVDALGTVVTLRVSTSAKECVLTVRSLGFYR